jgi:ferredoxin-NADP reductase
VLRNSWLHPLNDVHGARDLLQWLAPRSTRARNNARVLEVVVETADTRTFVLQPPRRRAGHRAGQHVALEVEIDGRRLYRCFSVSSASANGCSAAGAETIALTIKRQPGSKVSAWLHDHVRPGHFLAVSAPRGDFGLAAAPNEPVLLLSAGSGITPMMAILRDLHRHGYDGDVAFVHSCRTPADLIFGAELRGLAQSWPRLRLHVHHSAEQDRLDRAALARLVPDYAKRRSLVCGPQSFNDWVIEAYRDAGAPELLQSESFRGRVPPGRRTESSPLRVHCTVTERSFTANGAQALLVEAESAGLAPRHGCRMGICRSCQCHKRSGSVENLLTGVVSSEPDELIQLCISAARSDLELAL